MNSALRIPAPRLVHATGIALALLLSASAASAIPTALVREGSPLPAGPPELVTSINNTAVNHAGGYAVNVITGGSVSRIWGNAAGGPGAVMRSETTIGSLVQTAFESFYGMGNAGEICYSATGTGGPAGGFDAVFLDNTPVIVEGDPAPGYPGMYWSFGSRPGVTGRRSATCSTSTPGKSERSPITTTRAGNTRRAIALQSSGPIPAGSPEVSATTGRLIVPPAEARRKSGRAVAAASPDRPRRPCARAMPGEPAVVAARATYRRSGARAPE